MSRKGKEGIKLGRITNVRRGVGSGRNRLGGIGDLESSGGASSDGRKGKSG